MFEVLSAYCILPLSCAEVLPYVLAKLNYIDHQEIKKVEFEHSSINFNTMYCSQVLH